MPDGPADARLNPFAWAAAGLALEAIASADAFAASNPAVEVPVFGVEAAIRVVACDPAVPPATEAIASGVAVSLGGAG